MSPELPGIPVSRSCSDSATAIHPLVPFVPRAIFYVWYFREKEKERENAMLYVPPTLSYLPLIQSDLLLASLSLRHFSPMAVFRRTIETNRLIRSNVRRPWRLSSKDTIGRLCLPFRLPVLALSPFLPAWSIESDCKPARLLYEDSGEDELHGIKEPNSKERVPASGATFHPSRLAVKCILA